MYGYLTAKLKSYLLIYDLGPSSELVRKHLMSLTSSLRALNCSSRSTQQTFWHSSLFSLKSDWLWNEFSESLMLSLGLLENEETRVEDSHSISEVLNCDSCSSIWPKLNSSNKITLHRGEFKGKSWFLCERLLCYLPCSEDFCLAF